MKSGIADVNKRQIALKETSRWRRGGLKACNVDFNNSQIGGYNSRVVNYNSRMTVNTRR